MSTTARPLVLLGTGGHAQVLAALARAAGQPVLGVCDPTLAASGISRWEDLDVLGDDSALERLPPDRVALVLGIAVFGERPDILTLCGAAVIVGSGIYTFARERAARQRALSMTAPTR